MKEQRVLHFDDTEDGRSNFRYFSDGVVMGASKGEAKSDQTIRQNARIQRALRTISEPAANIDLSQRPVNARNLIPGGGQIELETGDIEQARKLILAVPWPGQHDIGVADLLDFIGTALAAKPDSASVN